MKPLRVIPVVILALAPAVFSPAGQTLSAARDRDSRTGKIIGVVLDPNNARVAGAAIRIGNARLSRELLSGDEGDFEVELPAGEYRMTVEQPGFHTFELSPLRVNGDVCELVNIHMKVRKPRGTLKVRVSDGR